MTEPEDKEKPEAETYVAALAKMFTVEEKKEEPEGHRGS